MSTLDERAALEWVRAALEQLDETSEPPWTDAASDNTDRRQG